MRIRITDVARREILEALIYIRNENPVAAAQIAGAIDESLTLLKRMPEGAPVIGKSNVRAKLVGRYPFRIYYELQDEIIVRNFRSTRRRRPGD